VGHPCDRALTRDDDVLLALALIVTLDMRLRLAHGHRGLGILDRNNVPRGEQAHAALSAIRVLSHGLAMTGWLPQKEATLAQVEAQ
jgi:hypothetical protein